MTGPAYDRVIAALEAAERPVKHLSPGRARSSCPGHDGDNPDALSIMDGETRVSLHCFTAQCDGADVLAALGLTVADRYHTPRTTYAYDDGRKVTRTHETDGRRRFVQSGSKSAPTLYRLDRIGVAETVYLVEGEEDVHALEAAGAVATTAPMGAESFAKVDSSPLSGKRVVAVVDRDQAGDKWAAAVRDALDGRAEVRFVRASVGKDASDHLAAELGLDDFEPWRPPGAERVDGAGLLDDLHGVLTGYSVLPSPAAADAVCLWIAATHAQTAWQHATRLRIGSPEKRCGKTRLLDVIEHTCHRPVATVDATIAALFRSIDHENPPTLIVDEADAIWAKKAADGTEDLRKLLNAGFGRGRYALRCVGPNQTVQQFATFAMVAIAGIGDMPDTITDRAVNIIMRRRARDEQVKPFRLRRDAPILHELRERLAEWVGLHLDTLTIAEPDMPVEDRAADVWEPLIALADVAGGDWPGRAREACRVLTGEAETDDTERSVSLQLLGDLRTVFRNEDRMAGETILDRLHKLEGAPWADWYGRPFNARDLAKMLRTYRVRPTKVKIGEKPLQGYRRDALHDAWTRYLAPAKEPEPTELQEPRLSEGNSQVPHAGQVPEPLAPPEPANDPVTRQVPKVPEVPQVPPAHPSCLCGEPLSTAVQRQNGQCNRCQTRHQAEQKRSA